MAAICFYFQVHQPFRIGTFSSFDGAEGCDYFDRQTNAWVMRKVAEKCYLPTNRLLLKLIQRFHGSFRCSFSITGTALEQMRLYAPEALESFQQLAQTGCVEFLAETSHHSLAALYDQQEFSEQARTHAQLMQQYFGYQPKVFRNTELIYNDFVAERVRSLGYNRVIAEGVDRVLGARSPNQVYASAVPGVSCLLKNYRLSDDVAFRFSDVNWAEFPLSPKRYAELLFNDSMNRQVVNLFMDYETFGEHQWEATGIFSFLEQLPAAVFEKGLTFMTPSEVFERFGSAGQYSCPQLTSWADEARDTSAWQGNRIQLLALDSIYGLKEAVLKSGDPWIVEVWRRLQTSDHFYYMSTKVADDGQVHAYFNAFDGPYDAFVHYMNVWRHFARHLGVPVPEQRTAA